jgi:hypothetical protein
MPEIMPEIKPLAEAKMELEDEIPEIMSEIKPLAEAKMELQDVEMPEIDPEIEPEDEPEDAPDEPGAELEDKLQDEQMDEPKPAEEWPKNLAEIHKAPTELCFAGSFEELRAAGRARQRWLLVNIQSPTTECASQQLNADMWDDETLQAFIKASFLFWQQDYDSPDGQNFFRFYPSSTMPGTGLPLIGIIDPFTGQLVKTWTGFKDAEHLMDKLMDLADSPPIDLEAMIAEALAREHAGAALPSPLCSAAATDPEKAEKVSTFQSVASCDADFATSFLEANAWNMDLAWASFFGGGGGDAPMPSASGSRVGADGTGASASFAAALATVQKELAEAPATDSVWLGDMPVSWSTFQLPADAAARRRFPLADLSSESNIVDPLSGRSCLAWQPPVSCAGTVGPELLRASELHPMHTPLDGDCLLHAASIGAWGVQDQAGTNVDQSGTKNMGVLRSKVFNLLNNEQFVKGLLPRMRAEQVSGMTKRPRSRPAPPS